jgi:hypothetical protein
MRLVTRGTYPPNGIRFSTFHFGTTNGSTVAVKCVYPGSRVSLTIGTRINLQVKSENPRSVAFAFWSLADKRCAEKAKSGTDLHTARRIELVQ